MNANYTSLCAGGMVLLIMAAFAQSGAKTRTLSGGNQDAAGQQGAARPDDRIFLPLQSAAANLTKHAHSGAKTENRYAAIGPSTNGLVGWWKFDETEGTLAADSSGNGHNGTLMNGPTWTTGPVRGALSFDGTNDQVTCVESAALRISGDLTIAFWTKKNAEAKMASRIIGKGNSAVRSYGVWEEAGNDGRLLFQQLDSAGSGINMWTTNKLAVATWYHVAAVVQGSRATMYINGKPDSSGKRGIFGPASTEPLTFGYSGWNDHYPGVLDDVRIYNRALTADEIAELHLEAAPDRRRAGGNLEPPARSQADEASRMVWSHSRGRVF